MGRLAVRRLLDRLQDRAGAEPFVRSLVAPQLVVRQSSVELSAVRRRQVTGASSCATCG